MKKRTKKKQRLISKVLYMNKLQITTEMRKRGLVLLVLIAVFLVTIVLINAAPTPGTCTKLEDDNFCIYVESKEKCTFPEYFAEGQQPEQTTECQQGCCLCTDGIDYVTDTTYAYGGPITTQQQCSKFCSDIIMQMNFNLSIKEIEKCVAQLQEYETAELSGYVYDMLGNPIKDAVIKIDDNETKTSESGYYKLTDLRPMPGQAIIVKHDSYVTNITQFDIKPGDNSLDFRLVSAEKG
ncbi:carboxypeptidase-like regulatory domain-containing protein, partial [Candidatus Woesearchaeota archaeon]|nr:carboxypeptidase-like regulatory domain-containing protein [Candidatus Woesearchaeota archaeon]